MSTFAQTVDLRSYARSCSMFGMGHWCLIRNTVTDLKSDVKLYYEPSFGTTSDAQSHWDVGMQYATPCLTRLLINAMRHLRCSAE